MANETQLEIIKQGVAAWHRWRRDNSRIKPDLSGADLNGIDLNGIDLRGADLSLADLRGADLQGGDLRLADLRGADFSLADLRKAKLNGTDLSGADLNETDLRGAYLAGADLSIAKLIGANLHTAGLRGAKLTRAICERANFSDANLELARLVGANLNDATLTGGRLWETQRTGWSIKGIVCEAVYWEEEEKGLTTYAPGEFERRYSDRPKIVLFYQGGISPLEFSTLPALVKHLEKSRPGCTLRLESITDASDGAVVTLAVEETDDGSPEGLARLKPQLEVSAAQAIKYQRKALAERETRLRIEGEVKQLGVLVEKLILRPSLSFYSQGDTNVGDKYNIGQAGAAGPHAHAHDMTFNQIGGNIEKAMELSALAGELTTLREAMSREAAVAGHYIALGEVAKAEEAAKAKDSSKVAESLKGAGKWALDVATKIGTSLASEALKESMGMK
jgi:uncharacterized protein YjbI with pentapeptide repeats